MPAIPPPLKKGGTVGVVAPGRWPKPEWIDKGKALLESRGYEVVVHAQCYLKDGQLGGSDAARTEAIMDMFADRTIDAVICARGGTGSIRLLDKLDYKLIKRNPETFYRLFGYNVSAARHHEPGRIRHLSWADPVEFLRNPITIHARSTIYLR